MCGLAGWADFTRDLLDQTQILKDMTDTLRLRGPDGGGSYTSRNVLLGHRRLVVVDPAGGSQPMIREHEGREYVIVYNGELYNTEDLRRELQAEGFSFRSYSDTEVLLTAYICWGEDCITKLNGIFAFAIYDADRRRLFLARDPLGVKPLFYAQRGHAFIFGSEIKTLLAHPLVKPEVGRDGLCELFALGPANAPGSCVYKGISEIPPAYCLTVTPEDVRLR
ncbi:MAG: asparagine synthetase B, partial [Clostridia bacterium]|nr:asparagine synthetase B [Clostridia bacterium]